MSSIYFICFSNQPLFVYLCVDVDIIEKLKAKYRQEVTIIKHDNNFIIKVEGSPPDDDVFMIVDASTPPPPPPPGGGKIRLIKTYSTPSDAQISSFLQLLAKNIDIITIRSIFEKIREKIREKMGGKKRFNKSTNRRSRSSKKRGTQRKQKRRQRRASRRAY